MNKEDFFKAVSPKTAQHKLADGVMVPIQELTSAQRAGLLELGKEGNETKANAKIVAWGCPLLDENDIDELAKSSGSVIVGIADAILNLSGIGEKKKAEAKNG
jgi:hypothetical protein